MIIEEVRDIKSTRTELRKFGITVGIVLGLLGALFLWRNKSHYVYFFMLSAMFLFFGLILPVILKPIHKVWMTLAILMGWLVTRIILIILFYLVVTPIGLLAKLFGKKFLDTKFNRNMDSYWIPRGTIKFKRSNYEKQF